MKKLAAIFVFLTALWLNAAVAQAPPPVPALPDSPRLMTYSISGSTCACAVNFQIYADNSSTDVDNWIQVFIGTSPVLSTDPTFGWVLTSPTGSLGNIARPITDAVLTFNSAQTGTITIVGAQRPRRLSEFAENRGVPARDHNQVLNSLFAEAREGWDRSKRSILGQPGEVLNLLPAAAGRAGGLLAFDGSGQPTITAGGAGTGNVLGPVSSVNGDLSCFNGTTGTLLQDCGAGLPLTGTHIASGTVANSNLVAGPANTAKGSLNGTTEVDLTSAQLTTLCNLTTASLSGCVPALPNDSTKFFNGVGLFTTPPTATVPFTAVMVNGTIVQSQATNAQTFTIKTLAGNTPSAGDPVTFLFRDVTAATGDYTVRTVTAALSITIPSGQAIGFLNATPGRVWINALDNAGTVELFVINCATQVSGSGISGTGTPVTGIYPLRGWGIISTSAVSGASSAQVAYSTTARTSVPYVPIGYATWETGGTLATAGTWNVAPTRLQLFQPGSTPLPGQEIQRQRQSVGAATTGTTTFATANTIPQNTSGDQYMSQVITPISSANVLEIKAQGNWSNSAAQNMSAAIFQDTTANAVVAADQFMGTATGMVQINLFHLMLAGTLSQTTFKVRAGGSSAGTTSFNAGNAVTPMFGGVMNSYLEIREIQD